MNADKRFEDMLVTPKLILRWIREGDVYVNRLGEDEMKSCKLQVEAALAQPEQSVEPPAYVEPVTYDYHNGWEEGFKAGVEASQPKQEPYCWVQSKLNQGMFYREKPRRIHTIPLYTAPTKRAWVGLTDEEILIATYELRDVLSVKKIIKSIEAKLKEKNT